MLFIENLKLSYSLEYGYLIYLSKFVELFYKIFVAFFVILGVYKSFSKADKEKGIKILVITVIVGILSQIKYLIGRARPKITFETVFNGPSTKYAYASFPSGHTFFIFASAKVLSNLYPKYRFLFYVFAFIVALERLLVFAHFPSDIIAGAFLGLYVSDFIFKKSSTILRADSGSFIKKIFL